MIKLERNHIFTQLNKFMLENYPVSYIVFLPIIVVSLVHLNLVWFWFKLDFTMQFFKQARPLLHHLFSTLPEVALSAWQLVCLNQRINLSFLFPKLPSPLSMSSVFFIYQYVFPPLCGKNKSHNLFNC